MNHMNDRNERTRGSHPARRRSLAASSVLLAAAVLLSGCEDITGGSNPRPTIQAVKVTDEISAFDASGGAGSLRFEGNITTPNDCQQLRAKLDRFSESNGVVDLVVEATAVEPCPNEEETVWNYLGRLNDVEPGTYAVTIEHRFRNQDVASEVVLEKQVEILPR